MKDSLESKSTGCREEKIEFFNEVVSQELLSFLLIIPLAYISSSFIPDQNSL